MLSLDEYIYERKIIGWGTSGYWTQNSSKIINKVEYLIDKDPSKWNQIIDGKLVKKPDVLKTEDCSKCIIIVFSSYYDEIEKKIIGEYGDFDIIDGYALNVFFGEKLYWEDELYSVINAILHKSEHVYLSVASLICSYGKDSGTQKFIYEQINTLKRFNKSIIHVIPLKMYISHSQSYVMIMYNHKLLGIMEVSVLEKLISKVEIIIVHSVVERRNILKRIIENILYNKLLIYVHDFSCVCNKNIFLYIQSENHTCMTYNSQQYICNKCEYFDKESEKIHLFYEKLFTKDNVIVITPSKHTKNVLTYIYDVREIFVIPHLKYEISRKFRKIDNRKLKIAFIGAANIEKGWKNFVDIVQIYKQKYEFYCLGRHTVKVPDIKYINVSALHLAGADDMITVLKNEKIDIAYLGSLCPETYSYTYFEALQVGVWILTNKNSGNIKDMVIEHNSGYVATDNEDIINLLENEEILRERIGNVVKIDNVRPNDEFLKLLK